MLASVPSPRGANRGVDPPVHSCAGVMGREGEGGVEVGPRGGFATFYSSRANGHPWRARPAVSPRRPVGCPGHPIWSHFRTLHPPLIYPLPPVRGAAATLLWYSPQPPAPARAALSAGAPASRCAPARPANAGALWSMVTGAAPRRRASALLPRAGRPSHIYSWPPRARRGCFRRGGRDLRMVTHGVHGRQWHPDDR